ncbi:MAG TPA: hypothetical protein VFR11_10910 [Micromonosporaceae bacterium]|jgi:hypothetical protein|nr:hypothetical protein [Micromonosporaceae bacterium]
MPTSRRWPVPHGLAVACGVVLFGAFFVLCGGISMGRVAVIGLGIGLIAAGAGLAILAVWSGRSSGVVMGIGHVLDRTDPPDNVEFGRCKLHLAVATRDLPSTSVKVREPRVPIEKWPDRYANLPVLVSTAKPLRVRVLWNRVPTHLQAAAARQREQSRPSAPADQPVPSAAMRVIYLDVSQVRWSDGPTPVRPPGSRPSPRKRRAETAGHPPDSPQAHIPHQGPASSDEALGNGAQPESSARPGTNEAPDTGDAHNGES